MIDAEQQIYEMVMASIKAEPDKWVADQFGAWQNPSFEHLYVNTFFRIAITIFHTGNSHSTYEYGNGWPWQKGWKLEEAIRGMVRQKEINHRARADKAVHDFVLSHSDPIVLARTALEKRGRGFWERWLNR